MTMEQHLPKHIADHVARQKSTQPCQHEECEEAINKVYRNANRTPPNEIVWLDSPLKVPAMSQSIVGDAPVIGNLFGSHRDKAEYFRDFSTVVFEQQIQSATNRCYAKSKGNFDGIASKFINGPAGTQRLVGAYYSSFSNVHPSAFGFARDALNYKSQTDMVVGLIEADMVRAQFVPLGGICFAIERQTKIRVDDALRLHCEDGPAIAWKDGWKTWAIHGVRVPQYVIEEPDLITIEDVDSETNSEVRRVKMDRFGMDRYVKEGRSKVVSQDDFGTLYLREMPMEREPMMVVQVINSTPEPDGSYKNYFLRVPPNVRTAKEAVSWTFGMRPEEFHLVQQT